MHNVWLVLLVVSFMMLLIILLRKKGAWQTFGYMALNIVIAAFILYFIDLFASYTKLHIPLNPTTVLTVGILGIPGLLLLVAIKLLLI